MNMADCLTIYAMGGGGASGGGGPSPLSTTPATGAKLVAKGKQLKKLDVKRLEAKAPPGCEKMVMSLKKKYGEDSSSPFKIAWAAHKKGDC